MAVSAIGGNPRNEYKQKGMPPPYLTPPPPPLHPHRQNEEEEEEEEDSKIATRRSMCSAVFHSSLGLLLMQFISDNDKDLPLLQTRHSVCVRARARAPSFLILPPYCASLILPIIPAASKHGSDQSLVSEGRMNPP